MGQRNINNAFVTGFVKRANELSIDPQQIMSLLHQMGEAGTVAKQDYSDIVKALLHNHPGLEQTLSQHDPGEVAKYSAGAGGALGVLTGGKHKIRNGIFGALVGGELGHSSSNIAHHE